MLCARHAVVAVKYAEEAVAAGPARPSKLDRLRRVVLLYKSFATSMPILENMEAIAPKQKNIK